MLDQRYFELEQRNEEVYRVDLYVKHKDIVEWLETQKPDPD